MPPAWHYEQLMDKHIRCPLPPLCMCGHGGRGEGKREPSDGEVQKPALCAMAQAALRLWEALCNIAPSSSPAAVTATGVVVVTEAQLLRLVTNVTEQRCSLGDACVVARNPLIRRDGTPTEGPYFVPTEPLQIGPAAAQTCAFCVAYAQQAVLGSRGSDEGRVIRCTASVGMHHVPLPDGTRMAQDGIFNITPSAFIADDNGVAFPRQHGA